MSELTVPCKVCGSIPARKLPIRRHEGMIVVQRFHKLEVPLCRTHGVQLTKQHLGKTLLTGWWGLVSFFVNWFVVFRDIVVLLQYRGLAAPRSVSEAISGQVPRTTGQVARVTGQVPRTTGQVPRITGQQARITGQTAQVPPPPGRTPPVAGSGKKRRKADEGQMSPAVMSNGSWGKDPYGRFPLRFFNGQYWTNQVADGDVISTDEPGWR